jgi:hypothetical protein
MTAGALRMLSLMALAAPAWAQDAEDPPEDAPTTEAPEDGPGDAPPMPSRPEPAPDGTPETLPERDAGARPAVRPTRRRRAAEDDASGPPPPEADFLRTDIEVKARLGFNGSSPGPFSLFSSLGGWNEFGVSIDAGLRNWKDFTIGLGGTIWYGQAGILGASTQRIANYDDIQFRWQMWESGGTVRSTFHYTALASIDPYLFGGVGAEAFQLSMRVRGWPFVGPELHTTAALRIEAGAGITGRIKGGNWVIGGELRYIVAVPFSTVDQLSLAWEGDIATFVLFPQHNPSRGFSWVIQAGYRF